MILRPTALGGVALIAAIAVSTLISNHGLVALDQFTTPSPAGSSNVQSSTSSISRADAPLRGAVFTVENTNDSGAGSLRQAILDANAVPGADTIVFDISFEEPHVIELASPLPPITDPVTLDGNTQAGTKPLLRRTISPELQVADGIPSLQIVIDGAGAGHADGLNLAAGNSIVRGLVVQHFDGNGIALTGAGENLVENNLISENAGTGIDILSGSGNRITGNSIFSNRGGGIDLAADGKNEIDPGDLDTGPNDLQNAPGLTSVRRFHCDRTDAARDQACGADDRGRTTAISGTIESLTNETFSLEFFATPPAESGAASDVAPAATTTQGETFLGEARVSTGPEGRASFTINLPDLEAVPHGTLITATATDSRGSTSEFSNPVAAPASVFSWAAAVSGSWNDPTKWTGGVPPEPFSDVQITVAGTYTVDLNESATLNSLTVGGATETQTFTMSANTLTLNAASAFSTNGVFQMSGGALNGTGTLTVASQLVWTGGTMTGAGIINANGGMSISGGSLHDLTSSRVLNTGGTTTWTGGQIRVGTGGSITNNGTWDCQNDLSMDNVFNGAAAFNNNGTGTFKKSTGAGTTAVNIPFNNSGFVEVLSGTIRLGNGGTSDGAFTGLAGTTLEFGGSEITHNLGATSSVEVPNVNFSGGTVNVDGGYNVASGTTVSGGTANFNPAGSVSSVGGALTISGGAANFSSGDEIDSTTLSLSGGVLQGTDTINVSGLTTWGGSGHLTTMMGAGITNANGGMSISGFINDLRASRVLNTGGTTTWTGGQIRVGTGGSITNNGTWDCQNDLSMDNVFNGAAAFNNNGTGTFKKSTGAGTTAVNIPFNNSGFVEVLSGTIRLGNGGTSDGAFTGLAGTTLEFGGSEITHNLGATSSVEVPNVNFSGGTVNVDGGYNVASGTTVSGGTANFNPAGSVSSVGGALTISGGAANFSSGDEIDSTTLSLSGGVLQGTDTINVSGLTTWGGSGHLTTMMGAGITNANGGMSISGFINDLRASRVLNTGGTTTWTGGQIRVGTGGSITNNGTWDCQNDLSMDNVFNGAAAFNNNGTGTFKKSTGAGTTAVNIPFNNSGFVEVLSGTIRLGNGGTSDGAFTGLAGTTLEFGGSEITHNLGATSSVEVPNVNFSGGTVNVDGGYNVASGTTVSGGTANFNPAGSVSSVGGALTISGGAANFSSGDEIDSTTLSLSGGVLQGTDTINVSGLTTWGGSGHLTTMMGAGITNANGGMSISGFINDLRASRVLNTGGTTTWTGGQIRVGTGGSITNNGTWDCQNDTSMDNVFTGAAAFNNGGSGTFKKSAGAGTTAVNIPFTNAGDVLALAGTLSFTNGYSQTAGFTTQNGGVIASPAVLNIQGGVLQGIGTVAASVSSLGQTGPGLSPGILGISGTYTQDPAGSFAVELGGTGHDRLDVAGAATLAGTLQVTLVDDFIPCPGTEFTILTCVPCTGTFPTTSLPPGIDWQVAYTATDVKLVVPESSVTAVNDGPICAGGTLKLTASTITDATYSWTGPNGFTSTLQNPSITNATAAATGNYSVVASVGGCTAGGGTTTATVTATGGACGNQASTTCDAADTCGAGGVCEQNFAIAGTACGVAGSQCKNQDTCNGSGSCTDNGFKSAATTCSGTSTGGACDATDHCSGSADACVDVFQPSSLTCRADTGQCDVAETCTGTSGACPVDGFEPVTTTCSGTSTGGACDATDHCSGSADACVDVFQPSSLTCRADTGQCDVAETCTGTSGACPVDGFEPVTTTCSGTSTGGACDATDHCSGSADACVDVFQPSSLTCRADTGQCDVAETCTGTSGACPVDGFEPVTTTCSGTSTGGACDATDHCSGSADACVDVFQPSSLTCRADTGQCDVAETCTGTSGACPVDGFEPVTTTCSGTSTGGACDATDHCSGSADACVDVFQPSSLTCRADTGQCDVAETCTGTSGACPVDGFEPVTTTCSGTSTGGACDATDHCSGSADACVDVFQPSSLTCRADTGQCDVAETCTGTSGACPVDGFEPVTTTCSGTSTGGACDATDHCSGSADACVDVFQPSSLTCRADTGQCDVAETCTGTSGACPVDGFEPVTTTCTGTSQGGGCDTTDHCSGSSNTCVDGFQASSFTCRTSAGQCDVAETCTGISGACPIDSFASSATTCTGTSQGGGCDTTDHCSGSSNTCIDGFQASSFTCRTSAGQCDVAETCTGISGACPIDSFASSATTCTGTSQGGGCDTTDHCSGSSNTCIDGFQAGSFTCRTSAGQCDVAETCTGISGACPIDSFASSATTCTGTSQGGGCDTTDHCSGSSNTCIDGFQAGSFTCRTSAGQCDVAETCTGSSGACPADAFATNATACTGASQSGACDNDAADHCTGNSNMCADAFRTSALTCRNSAGQCDVAEVCTGFSGACPANAFASPATTCTGTSQGGACDNDATDRCIGNSNLCVDAFLTSAFTCRDSAGPCDVAETCTGTSGTCPANGFRPAGTACGNPSSGSCDNADTCDIAGSCQVNHVTDGTGCGDAGTSCTNQDTCLAGACHDNGFKASGTACGDSSSDPCDGADTCDGTGSCEVDHVADGTTCSDGDSCTAGESCRAGTCVPPATLGAQPSISVGSGPRGVAAGDWTGDGILDLAVASQNTSSIYIFKGNDSGGFAAAPGSPVTVGSGPRGIAVGDWNGNGVRDLAVANANSNTISILVGDGSGRFTAAGPAVSVGDGPVWVATGDWDGDGKADLAAANSTSNTISILMGDGTGGFVPAPGSPHAVATNPVSVVAGDWNGDGTPDLAVANSVSNNVTILLGFGNGEFGEALGSPVDVAGGPFSLTAFDSRGSGILDLAVVSVSGNTVTVLLGNGTGGFGAQTPITVGASPRSSAAVDLNRDGKPDLVVANFNDDNLTILLGNGAGGFAAYATSGVGNSPNTVVAGDWDRDGKQDLAVSNTNAFSVSILLNTTTHATNGFACNDSNACTTTDACQSGVCAGTPVANGTSCDDGNPCTVSTSCRAGICVPPVSFMQPAGSPVATGGVGPRAIVIGNFDGGSTLDLAVANRTGNSVSSLLGTGTGGFIAAAGSPFSFGAGPIAIAVGDWDGSGTSDLALANSNTGANSVTILKGNTTGGFTTSGAPVQVGTVPVAIATGDLRGDPTLDLAVANQNSNDVTILENFGGLGVFVPFGSPIPVGTTPVALAVGDFNGDAKLDIAVANFGAGPPGTVTILLGNGLGGFTPATGSPVAVGTGPFSIAVGDLNEDGRLDLAVANNASNNVTVLLSSGAGTFSQAAGSPIPVATGPRSVVARDLNRDGRLDLAVANFGSDNVTVLLGNGAGGFGSAATITVAPGDGPSSVAGGDLNGDGKEDLVVANTNTNNVTILLNNTPFAVDGTTCDDASARTYSDVCTSGTCAGTSITCTSDQCNSRTNNGTSTCTVTPLTGRSCSDANACTYSDTCNSFGACVGTPITCTDDPCTVRQCNGTSECAVFFLNGSSCDDGNVCTAAEECQGGFCGANSVPLPCDDGRRCTIDGCNSPTGCVHILSSCNDTNACTTDVCQERLGGCIHTQIGCSDGDACTIDSCNSGSGCLHTPANCSESAAGFGQTLTTDSEGDASTPADPVETTVTTSAAGAITIQESAATMPPPIGLSLLNLQIRVTAPPGTVANPIRLVFVIDASALPPGPGISALVVYKNGAVIADCTGPAGTAHPDPCVASRQIVAGGDASITVLTSTLSDFNFAFPPCQAPSEVVGLRGLSDKSTLVWDPSPGSGVSYDVSRGLVSQLPVGAGTSEDCFAVGLSVASIADDASPQSAGSAFWYLVRARNACGVGIYGLDSHGVPRNSSACP